MTAFQNKDCSGWESESLGNAGIVGDMTAKDQSWTSLNSHFCANKKRLYCIQQGAGNGTGTVSKRHS